MSVFWLVAVVVVIALGLLFYIKPPKTKRKCENCRHFSLSEGQAMIDRYPLFRAASSAIPPQVMGCTVDDEGNAIDNNVPLTCKWTDFGMCLLQDTVLWHGETCDNWSRRFRANT